MPTRTTTSPAPGSGVAAARSTRRSRGAWSTAAFTRSSLTSGRGVAAVEEDRLAGHEAGAAAGQEDGQRADLLQPAGAAGGNVARQALVDLWVGGRRLVHLPHEPARRDCRQLAVVARPL